MSAPETPSASTSSGLSYRDAGVDIEAGDALVDRIKPFAKRTMREGVLGGIGGFGALFELSKKYQEPVLVSGTDGVGTKLKLAFALNRHDTVGQDLVAMSVNDILVQGAEPLFFLDYFACGKLDVDTAATVVKGIAQGCELAGCALIGGETAELPGVYREEELDFAGTCVGIVERERLIDGSRCEPGDLVLGLPSSGLHTNGFSLVRALVGEGDFDADLLLAPHRLYLDEVRELRGQADVKALAHVTGGGILGNLARVLPDGVGVELNWGSWKRPPVYDWLAAQGVEEDEQRRVFNVGIGMCAVVPAGAASAGTVIGRLT